MPLDDNGCPADATFSFSAWHIVDESAASVAIVYFADLCFLLLLGAPCSSDASSTEDLACSSPAMFSRCSISSGSGNANVGC